MPLDGYMIAKESGQPGGLSPPRPTEPQAEVLGLVKAEP